MILLWLTAVNLVLSFVSAYAVRISGLEITPAAIIILALRGESVVLSALLLNLAYMLPKPERFSYGWLHLPAAIAAGYLAVALSGMWIAFISYFVIVVLLALAMGNCNGRFAMFALVNLGVNLVILRLYGFTQ